jgi:NAD(P)-dependent dehydrogenase (short-subunit alcohol dehydrogenase family)
MRVIDINLTGICRSLKAEIPVMLTQGHGAIVNCSSALGFTGIGGSSAYVASKHGIIGLTKAAALEYAADGVRINAVSPGFIRTPMIEEGIGTTEAALAPFVALHPIGRLGFRTKSLRRSSGCARTRLRL